jgi:hypothetical protein
MRPKNLRRPSERFHWVTSSGYPSISIPTGEFLRMMRIAYPADGHPIPQPGSRPAVGAKSAGRSLPAEGLASAGKCFAGTDRI